MLIFIIVLLIFVLIYICIEQYIRPLKRLEKQLSRYRETGDLTGLRGFELQGYPELKSFLDRTVEELDSDMLMELKSQRAEYLALQNQINPHFLFNTLEDIRGDALEAGMIGLTQTIGALSTYFRYTISETRELVWLEDEIDNIEDYYTIQKYRFGDRISLITELVNEHLGFPKVKLPKLTLQPIVENAFSHGLERQSGNGEIRIVIEPTQNSLVIRVIDNGIGMPIEKMEEINRRLKEGIERSASGNRPDEGTVGTAGNTSDGITGNASYGASEGALDGASVGRKRGGIALYNVNSRIRLLFGGDYGITVFSAEGIGTEVQIRLPLIDETRRIGAR